MDKQQAFNNVVAGLKRLGTDRPYLTMDESVTLAQSLGMLSLALGLDAAPKEPTRAEKRRRKDDDSSSTSRDNGSHPSDDDGRPADS